MGRSPLAGCLMQRSVSADVSAATLDMLPLPSRAKSRIEGKSLQKITIFKAPQGFDSRDPMDLIQDPK